MRVTTKGQVTIPQEIGQNLGITANSEVDFLEDGDRIYPSKNWRLQLPIVEFGWYSSRLLKVGQ